MIRKSFITLLVILLVSSCEKVSDLDIGSMLKLYGDALEDIGYSVAEVQDGYIIGGQFTDVVRSGALKNYIENEKSVKKMAVIKTDKEGNVIWKKSFNGGTSSCGTKVMALGDGSIICLGYTVDTATAQKDIFIVKLSADGTTIHQKTFNSKGTSVKGDPDDGNQWGIDMAESGDEIMLLCSTDLGRLQGSTGNAAGKTDIFLIRIDKNLEMKGVPEPVGFPGNDLGSVIKPAINGGYIIAGTTDKTAPGQALNNIIVLTLNSWGGVTSMKIIGADDDEYASDLEVLKDGYLIAGVVGGNNAEQSVFISKLNKDISADPEFQSKYKLVSGNITATSFAVKAICPYRSQSFVLVGQAGSGSSAKLLAFVINPLGDYDESKVLISASDGIQIAYDVITDENNNIITIGKDSFENNSMISFYRFRF